LANPPGKADLVLHEGAVHGHPGSDSVAITGDRISAHGPFADLKALVGPRTHLVKLAGRTVAPGFVDSHLHFFESAAAATGLSVARCRSIAELLAALRLAAGKTPPGNWLRAFGCDEALLAEGRGPTREELDQAVPKNPLRLRHQTLHASWLNSRAIKLVGLEEAGFRPPAGASAEHDDAGRLSGLVTGMEQEITRRLPLVTKAETESRARIMSRELAAAGITAFTDATVRNGPEDVELFARLSATRSICQRVGVMIGAHHLDAAGAAAKFASGRVRLAGLKFMPGAGAGETTLVRRVRIGLSSGLDCAFHATEVEELEEALGAIELAMRQIGERGTAAVYRIEHGGVIAPEQVERLAALHAWVVTNPGFVRFRGPKYAREPGLLPYLYRARSLRAAGIEIAGATDAPVTPARPLAAIAAAISRETIDGDTLAPAERLSAAEALTMFTRDGARLARIEAGAIEPDMLADLVVLPHDPAGLEPAELAALAVDITIIEGKVVYERGRPAIAWSDTADLHSA
jgi:predicted amidohydrolase YtcJ